MRHSAWTQTFGSANVGVVKIKLTVGKVATAAAVSMKGGGEQVNGRERETATLLSKLSVKPKLVRSGFAPRHLRRSVLSGLIPNEAKFRHDLYCLLLDLW